MRRGISVIIALSVVGTTALLGVSMVSAENTNFTQRILPLDCQFEEVNDGLGTLHYLTPAECGVFIGDSASTERPPTYIFGPQTVVTYRASSQPPTGQSASPSVTTNSQPVTGTQASGATISPLQNNRNMWLKRFGILGVITIVGAICFWMFGGSHYYGSMRRRRQG